MMNEEIITPGPLCFQIEYAEIIVVALEDELPAQLAPDWSILYTGVGKDQRSNKSYGSRSSESPFSFD